jgi:glycosyltransferase involved in cell wall biosynthesis
VHAHAVHKLSGQVVALARREGIPTLVKIATQCDLALFSNPEGEPAAPRSLRRRRDMRVAFTRLQQADAFVALNPAISEEIRSYGLRDLAGSNGVDTGYFRPPETEERREARTKLGLQKNVTCIVYVGRLADRKDLRCLVVAAARLNSRRFPFEIVVAGDGPERSRLIDLGRRVGLSKKISFLGETEHVRDVLWAADLFVNPSRREGLPNAVLEAWACGRHTVLSDVPGHSEHSRSSALLFGPGDSSDLANQILSLSRNGIDSSLCDAARSYVVENFSLASVAARYDAIYRKL